MEKITDRLRNPAIGITVGAIIGLILGLLVGWVVWPVQYTDVEPQHLRADLKVDYLCMVIDSFERNGNAERATQRFGLLGDQGSGMLKNLDGATCGLPADAVIRFGNAVGVAAPVVVQPTAISPAATAVVETPTDKKPSVSPVLVGVLCLATLAVGGILAYILLFRKKSMKPGFVPSAANQAMEANKVAAVTDYTDQGEVQPVAQFVTTYINGDDLYDDSFSIDSPTGEFLGECGVGISETIGVGDPKKVAALEVWLFDKNDIQTITKVLMSKHTFEDAAARARLASKGEAVELTKDKIVLMDTQTLTLQARVVDMAYGQGAMAPGSYFERLTLELAIWQKAKE